MSLELLERPLRAARLEHANFLGVEVAEDGEEENKSVLVQDDGRRGVVWAWRRAGGGGGGRMVLMRMGAGTVQESDALGHV